MSKYEIPSKPNRVSMVQEYRNNMVEFVYRITGLPKEQIRIVIEQQIVNNIKRRRINTITFPEPGVIKEQNVDALDFFRQNNDQVISQSGTVYSNIDEKESFISQMVDFNVKDRGASKKKMLKYANEGNEEMRLFWHYRQASAKIKNNSLIGAMGSPFNVFYDRAGFNSVTSFCRALIMTAYSICERLLGSNYYFPTEEYIINYWVTNLRDITNKDDIRELVIEYNLYIPTIDDIRNKFLKSISLYDFRYLENDKKFSKNAEKILASMDDMERVYIFYTQDLNTLLKHNEHFSRPWFDEFVSLVNRDYDCALKNPAGYLNEDEDIQNVLTVICDHLMMNCTKVDNKTGEEKRCNKYEVAELYPEVGRRLTAIGEALSKNMNKINKLLDMFVYTRLTIDHVHDQNKLKRKVVAVSDTDSVIFTTQSWAEWYLKTDKTITDEGFCISSIMIYLLTKVIEFALNRLSQEVGARNDGIKIMKMKNEFLYPTMLVYQLKKTYAAVCKIQEGVVFPELKKDLKGSQIRGSSKASDSIKSTEKFLLDIVLKPAQDSNLVADDLYKVIEAHETEIYQSIMNGELKYCSVTSVKQPDTYKAPMSSNYFYWVAWEAWFAKDYGSIELPTKVPSIPLIPKFTPEVMVKTKKISPKLFKRIEKFRIEYGKLPSSMIFNPLIDTIPEEMRHLIDVRKIIFSNLSSMYLTLEALGLGVGFKKDMLLVSEMRHNIRI